jgi:Kef-type K+ transport system membrane component KefB
MLLGSYVAGLTVSSLPDCAVTDGQRPLDHAFDRYVAPVRAYLLEPVFFASIGSAIPFLSLWTGKIIWQGVVYAVLMTLAAVFG